MFGKRKKQSPSTKSIRFLGGPWDGAIVIGDGRPPYEIEVCTHRYGDRAWRHSYLVLQQQGHWLGFYAGLYKRTSWLKPIVH